jgi:hypothetical protein
MDDKKDITLTINGDKIRFNVDTTAQEHLIDETRPDSKVAPMHRFLMRTVAPDSKDALKPLLENPSTVMIIGNEVVTAYMPQLKITLGE